MNIHEDQSLVVYVVEVFSHFKCKIKENPKKIVFFNQPPTGGWLITPEGCRSKKENEATILA